MCIKYRQRGHDAGERANTQVLLFQYGHGDCDTKQNPPKMQLDVEVSSPSFVKGPFRKFNVARKRKLVAKGAGGPEAFHFQQMVGFVLEEGGRVCEKWSLP